ncbi:hypothetical protein [Stratiformator vulcanicus]|nr:hypothetical protein [Stratiformator vulcanicus]
MTVPMSTHVTEQLDSPSRAYSQPASESNKPAADQATTAQKPTKLDETALQDRMPDWFKTSRAIVWYALLLGAMFTYLAFCPLWYTDLWGHLAYGRLIAETGSIPETAPLMPLAEGVRFVDTAWLSQLIAYVGYERFGVSALPALAAALMVFCAGALAYRAARTTSQAWCGLVAIALFLLVDHRQLFATSFTLTEIIEGVFSLRLPGLLLPVLIRPQLAGLACFVATLCLLTGRRSIFQWIAIPAVFAAWANLHGSFVVGIGLIGVFAIGRAGDILRRTDSFRRVLRDGEFWRYVMFAELAAVSALINPYGLELYASVLTFGSNPNLADLVEWRPLTLRMQQGQLAAFAAISLVVLYCTTPRRIRTVEPFLLIGFGLLSLWMSRFLIWWGPIAAYYGAIHAGALWQAAKRKRLKKAKPGDPSPAAARPVRRSVWTVAAAGLMWIFFAVSPFGMRALGGPDAEQEAKYFGHFVRNTTATPVDVTEYLIEHPPVGQVFNPYEWGDYLMWAGPPELEVFVASHAHLVPSLVWEDYMRIIRGTSGWDEALERYGVNTIVLNNNSHASLIASLSADVEGWRQDYRDTRASVFTRIDPIQ